jgi:DNA-binding CsgD family transcriptional regulator
VPAPASLLLSAAAVVGDPFDIGLAAAGAALPDSEALDLLDELCRRQLVRPTDVPRRFAFRHPVLRRAVYGSAGPGWRTAARARAADAVRGPAAVPTHLVGRTAAAGDDEVVALLSSAAPVAAGAPATAALRLRRPEALHLLGQALAALPDPYSMTATRLRVAIGTVHLWGSDHTQAWHWARRAHGKAQDPVLRGAAAALVAGAASRAGAVAEARSAAGEATALLDPLPDEAVAAQLDTLLLLGWSETTIERPGAACAHLRRALVLADRTGQAHLLPEVLYSLAAALTWSGELTEAACAGDDAIEAALSAGAVDSHLWALRTRCTTAIVAGDLAAASRLGEEACGLAGTTAGTTAASAATLVGAALAEVRLAAGEHDAGITALQDVAGGPDLPRIAQRDRPYWFALLAEAGIRSGRRVEATGWAERAEQASAGLELDGRTGWALRAAAAVRNAHREHARAADLALRSAELLGRAGNPVEAARSRTLARCALGAAGHRSRARAELTAAAAVLERCGAVGLAAETIALLRGIRSRSAGAGSTARDVLSPREHQIAQLVATGRTNREIAEELLLSVKTIETHLGRAFGKLGVPTRSALAAEVRAGA